MSKPLAAAGKLQERCNELEAENAALKAELVKEEEAHFKTHNWLIDRNEELVAAQKDAERYRWLRDTQEGKTVRILDRREWDEAIDAAIAKENGK